MSIDGISKTLQPGELLKLSPGESVCIEPYIYHSFWREDEASGKILIGEVSKVNDDKNDNKFYEPMERFSEIKEDEEPIALLFNDYENFVLK